MVVIAWWRERESGRRSVVAVASYLALKYRAPISHHSVKVKAHSVNGPRVAKISEVYPTFIRNVIRVILHLKYNNHRYHNCYVSGKLVFTLLFYITTDRLVPIKVYIHF